MEVGTEGSSEEASLTCLGDPASLSFIFSSLFLLFDSFASVNSVFRSSSPSFSSLKSDFFPRALFPTFLFSYRV